ncbi:hypothetical protein SLEP1_g21666 [Rubroshorea leprosula]|uniref:Uncharacterized protein n=1 Tax=Rubroshorea leprosula TaxID=152421 RepID=A0AAV5JHE2_9ROSI|nr:hypothetical protein SLEP1_g21666 [Rubroshorea leprosula]
MPEFNPWRKTQWIIWELISAAPSDLCDTASSRRKTAYFPSSPNSSAIASSQHPPPLNSPRY